MEFNNNVISKIPSLKQADNSFQRYQNPLNELQIKSESNSFEQKQPNYLIPMQPYIFYPSTPIYPILGEIKSEYIEQANQFMKHGIQNSLASMIQQQIITQNEFKTNQTVYGCKKMCEIDSMLIGRYYNQKYWIFQNSNQNYKIDQTKTQNTDWLKSRLKHRYKSQIYASFLEMIDLIQEEGELFMNARTQAIKLQNIKVFQNLERQIQKLVKSKKNFDVFLLEIQKVLADFIFSSLN
ncbi:unnamed protein product [Paramecium pentaurelia]|uniref:Uncharacterized protein n=1 Tax=Paramecium pentaurelia TaxID=43138 RepID=A0A8S1XGE5_9CILI|nr:unnamed protein product [Paramecium pentaurelia]